MVMTFLTLSVKLMIAKRMVASWVFSIQVALDLLPLATQFEKTFFKMLFTMVFLFNSYRTLYPSKVSPMFSFSMHAYNKVKHTKFRPFWPWKYISKGPLISFLCLQCPLKNEWHQVDLRYHSSRICLFVFWGCLRGYAYNSFHELPPGEQCKDMLNVKLDTTP